MHLHLLHGALLCLALQPVELQLLVQVRRDDVCWIAHEVGTVMRKIVHGALRRLVARGSLGPARLRVLVGGHSSVLPFNLELVQNLLFSVLAHQGCGVSVSQGPLAIRLPLRLLLAWRIERRRKAQVLICRLV